MRSYAVLGLAAIAAASPAPQGFNYDALNAIPVTAVQGPPMGVAAATATGGYNSASAIAVAEAAAAPTRAPANNKRELNDLEKRTFCLFGFIGFCPKATTSAGNGYGQSTPTPTPNAPATTPAPTANPTGDNLEHNDVPSSCTPVDWTNTWAFTADPACATDIEVGTFCGFINPLDPCAAQPKAYAPATKPDTAEAFLKNTVYSGLAVAAKTPTGYAQTFKNLQGSVGGISGYLTYKRLTTYNVEYCAAECNNDDNCQGFNIFIERDPAWNPEQCSCPKADGVANFKCTLWGSSFKASDATNVGSTQAGFEIVIAGSNGYLKSDTTPVTPPNTSNPQDCGGKLHNQQPYCIGDKSFPGPFDVSICAALAAKQNVINVKAGFLAAIINIFNPYKCVQFQASYLEKDGKAWGTNCRLYTKKFNKIQANLDISLGGKSPWNCKRSFTYDIK